MASFLFCVCLFDSCSIVICFENGPVISQFIGDQCSYDNNSHNTTFPTVAVVDLERVNYQVTEGNTLQVCAVVRTPNITCPVTFFFDINLSVGEGIVNTNEPDRLV